MIGDGDPIMWSRNLPDGRSMIHPPWGSIEIRENPYLTRRDTTMRAFGIKPAMIVKPGDHGQYLVKCDCSACEQLRSVSPAQRAGAAFGYVAAGMLSVGILVVVVLALVLLVENLWRLL